MVTYPKDWKEVLLCDLLAENPRNGLTKPKAVRGSGVKMVGMGELFAQPHITDVAMARVPVTVSEMKNYELQMNDLLFARQSLVLEGAGKCSIIAEIKEPTVFESHLIRIRIEENKADPNYIFYWFNHTQGRTAILSLISRVAAAGVRSSELVKIPIPIPSSVPEQKAIVATLSSFDTHIDNLTALIAKKKAIRDGALADLMSSRTRLEGFSGEWEEYQFDDYFSLIPNNTLSRDKLSNSGAIGDVHYGDVLIKYGDILSDKDIIPRIKNIGSVNENHFLQTNDVIIADTAEDETVGKVVQIGEVSISLLSGLHTVACRPNYKTALGFLGYYMNSNLYHNQLCQYITGIKVSSLSKKSLKDTILTYSPDKLYTQLNRYMI